MYANYYEVVLKEITDFYLQSRDFNGIPIIELEDKLSLNEQQLNKEIILLLEQELVSVIFGDIHPNSHIKAFQDETTAKQIEKLKNHVYDRHHVCVYPSSIHLDKKVEKNKYNGRPYTLSLALGTPQLAFKTFDLSILEDYRNDPRYFYDNTDIDGSISIISEYFKSDTILPRDEVLLQTFGFCYNKEMNRAVAVYVRYLSDLTPEHQQKWQAKELSGEYQLHPDYFRMTIMGDFPERISIFQAFIEELQIINKMSNIMNRPSLFNQDFTKETSPREFSFLVRPTLKEFNEFILLLDKLLSDNINKYFFKKDISFEREEVRKDRKIVVQQKGTIQILDEWIHSRYRVNDWEPIETAITTFRSIRNKRQKPAHLLNENTFDQKYFQEQRQMISSAYEAIRTIRLLFTNYPGCEKVEITEETKEGKIWTY